MTAWDHVRIIIADRIDATIQIEAARSREPVALPSDSPIFSLQRREGFILNQLPKLVDSRNRPIQAVADPVIILALQHLSNFGIIVGSGVRRPIAVLTIGKFHGISPKQIGVAIEDHGTRIVESEPPLLFDRVVDFIFAVGDERQMLPQLVVSNVQLLKLLHGITPPIDVERLFDAALNFPAVDITDSSN